MLLPPRILSRDEELGKRDDDHRPGTGGSWPSLWGLWWGPSRFRRKRFLPLLVLLFILYLLLKRLVSNPILEYADSNGTSSQGLQHQSQADWPIFRPGASPPPPGAPPNDGQPGPNNRNYDGPVEFYRLASTLHTLGHMKGDRDYNRNVLFAASSLKSAAVLLPMACEMARWRRNYVHFAIMSREDVPVAEILEVNGIGPACDVMWHDARVELSAASTDSRLYVSYGGAMYHIEAFMHPQAVLIDGSGQEDPLFLRALREKLVQVQKPLIEMPNDVAERFMWITRLDYGSLRAWNEANIDILIQAPSDSSGSLIKLLRCLERADYFSSTPPRLTIELPRVVEYPTQLYLETFRWPPGQVDPRSTTDQLMLRHRISYRGVSAEEASLRFVESFYPRTQSGSHLLVLSPQAELSPLFYHYAKYALLEYKFAAYTSPASRDMFGVSLELPLQHLNDSAAFTPPLTKRSVETPDGHTEVEQPSLFLWQAPNSNAALYFGEKWAEFHDFLSGRLESQHTLNPPIPEKIISKKRPAWTEYLLELFRTRGYYMLYPNFELEGSLAAVHNELFQSPEEFPEARSSDAAVDPAALTIDPAKHGPKTEAALLAGGAPLTSLLPAEGDLPEVRNMPVLSYDGHPASLLFLEAEAAAFASEYIIHVGGCRIDQRQKRRTAGSAADLFCLDDDDDDDDDQPVELMPPKPINVQSLVAKSTTSSMSSIDAAFTPVEVPL